MYILNKYRTNNFGAKIQRKITGGKFDHIALCVKVNDYPLKIFDSTSDDGVCLMDWNEYITVNDLFEK